MMSIERSVEGLPALLEDERLDGWLRSDMRKAHKLAWQRWCKPTNKQGLQARFSANAFARLGLSQRSRFYSKRQQNRFGRALPYYSPNRATVHLRDTLKTEGIGWRARLKNNGQAVESVLSFGRQANKLNFHPEYRAEFLSGLNGKGPRGAKDAEVVQGYIGEEFEALLEKRIARAGKRARRAGR